MAENSGFRIGLALGGGAARAFSHIGVLAGLEKHGISVDVVSGTSMGAVIGAMYATHADVARLRGRIDAYLKSEEFADSGFDFFRAKDARNEEGFLFQVANLARRGLFNTMAVTRTALVSDETAAQNFAFLVDDLNAEETSIPFAATALDLREGNEVTLDRGPLRSIVAASCAMPGILNPVELDGRLLVDGGWAEAVPVNAARSLGADFVIATEVGGGPPPFETPRNTLDVVSRADALARRVLVREQLKRADFILAPHNGVKHWADFSTAAQAIARGEEEVEELIGELKSALRRARMRHFFGCWHPGRRSA